MTRSAERGSGSTAPASGSAAPNHRRRAIRQRPPPLVVPARSRLENITSLPPCCYESAQPSLPVPVSWPAEGPPAAAATRRGARRPVNEDRVFADARAGIYGVCDGHGGKQAAEFVADALVAARVPFQEDAATVCDAFQTLNHQLLSAIPGTNYVGTTVTAVAVNPGECLRLIHLGDCRAVLIDAAGAAHSLTVDHCPNRHDESLRIADAGGAVFNGRVNGVLAVSRALGDYALKDVLSPVPDVIDRALSNNDHLLVVGSDGFFDCVSNDDLAAALANMAVLPGTSAVPVNLKAAVLSLINLAVTRRSTDDISLVLIDIRVSSATSSSSL